MTWSLQHFGELSDAAFERWRALLEARSGMSLSEAQRVYLQTQLAMRAREMELPGYEEYYAMVTADTVPARLEWQHFIDHLAVRETRFFRHPQAVEFVVQHVRSRLKASPEAAFDIWSVGCSSGEEPYTLAMAINDAYLLAELEPRFSITATDISRAALAVAKAGIYSERKLELVPTAQRRRYFIRHAGSDYKVEPDIAERICFNQGNVLDISAMPALPVDVVFCQNLLIYFRKELRMRVLDAFASRLKPGGILVIGLGEIANWKHPKLRRVASEAVQVYIHE